MKNLTAQAHAGPDAGYAKSDYSNSGLAIGAGCGD